MAETRTGGSPSREIWFYHMVRFDLERVLPDLLQKTLARGWRALVRFADAERVEHWNGFLWTFDPASFLPHGSEKDGAVARQPVLLTCGEDNLNQADVLFLTGGVFQDDISSFERCVVLFAERDRDTVQAARQYWQRQKTAGHVVKYWQQSSSGQWDLKATDGGGAAS